MVISLDLYEILNSEKIVAVIRENTYEQAKFAIEKVIENGIKIIEITLTTPRALELLKHFKEQNFKDNKNLIIGTGTVLSLSNAINSLENGAQFLVSPHLNEEVSAFAIKNNIAYLPGVFTPKEAIYAYEKGHKVLKLFPSNILGASFVANLRKPYPFLNFMPSGGVNLSNLKEWLESGCVAVSVGGNLINGKNDLEIKNNIKKYLGEINEFKSKK